MKIACLQFAPELGDVDNNLSRADIILGTANPADLEGLDLLVLPELAFTGMFFSLFLIDGTEGWSMKMRPVSCPQEPLEQCATHAGPTDKRPPGYNFKSLHHIAPFLEFSDSGISSLWARTTALKYDCSVVVGYPEKVDVTDQWPASPEYYNSALVVDSDGDPIANYRKSHLYHTDETWALEGRDGFFEGEIPRVGYVAMGICMDLKYVGDTTTSGAHGIF